MNIYQFKGLTIEVFDDNASELNTSAGFVDIDGQPRLKGSRIDKGADELQ